MATKKQKEQEYINQHNSLEAEFFDVVDEGLPEQHRVLKDGKSIGEFNQQQGALWQSHEAKLIAAGFMEVRVQPEPVMDYKAEILKLQDEVKKIKEK